MCFLKYNPQNYPQLFPLKNLAFFVFCVVLSHKIPYSTKVTQINPKVLIMLQKAGKKTTTK